MQWIFGRKRNCGDADFLRCSDEQILQVFIDHLG